MIQRKFYPGDNWVYFKIYMSPLSSNNLLLKRIYPLIKKWNDDHMILKWFFIRYSDPNYHLRVRVEATDTSYFGKIVLEMRNVLNEDLTDDNIFSIQIDTYQREIERYGTDSIIRSEEFFCVDSENVIEEMRKNPSEDDMLVRTIIWLYELFRSVNMTIKEILSFVKEMESMYEKEFQFSTEQVKIINGHYRIIRPNIFAGMLNLYNNWQESTKDNEWINIANANKSLLPSLIHMHINRLFSVNQRVYEFMIYHMFRKALDSVIKQAAIRGNG